MVSVIHDYISMGPDPRQILKTATLFSSGSEEDLGIIASLSGILEFTDGSNVFSAGDPPRCLYVIQQGGIDIRKNDDEGRPVDIARFLAGDCFGELDMFTGEKRNASAYAVGPTTLLAFPFQDNGLDVLEQEYPGVHARLLYGFLIRISARIRNVNALVKENSPLVQELKKQVYVDKLTGLYNRTYFDETLERVLRETQEPIGLLFYKPDNFKIINDRYGHEKGDMVLQLIADSLGKIVPRQEMLFRYMGNENAVILPNSNREQLRELTNRMGHSLRTLDLSPVIDDESLRLSVSFGLVISPEHGSTVAELTNSAHALTMESRRRGGNLTLFPEDSE